MLVCPIVGWLSLAKALTMCSGFWFIRTEACARPRIEFFRHGSRVHDLMKNQSPVNRNSAEDRGTMGEPLVAGRRGDRDLPCRVAPLQGSFGCVFYGLRNIPASLLTAPIFVGHGSHCLENLRRTLHAAMTRYKFTVRETSESKHRCRYYSETSGLLAKDFLGRFSTPHY